MSLTLVDSSKNFLPGCTNHKSEVGFVMLTGLPGEMAIFFCYFLYEFRIVTLHLRCYHMVVFCLISPDFATCPLALHNHLVSVVVKRLSNFESLALSTLAPMFKRAQGSLFAQGHLRMISFFCPAVTSIWVSSL